MSGHIPDAKSCSWNTPKYILDPIRDYFNGQIDLDPCSNSDSIVGAKTSFVSPEHDGLVESWSDHEFVYVNPPFGYSYNKIGTKEYISYSEFKALEDQDKEQKYTRKSIYHWVEKCQNEAANNPIMNVVALIPAYTDSKTWQDLVFKTASHVCFIKGRIKFGLNGTFGPDCAPMGCALVHWGINPLHDFAVVLKPLGKIIVL